MIKNILQKIAEWFASWKRGREIAVTTGTVEAPAMESFPGWRPQRGMRLSLVRQIERARSRRIARDNYRKAIGAEHGVNFHRVFLTSKMVDGKASYTVS